MSEIEKIVKFNKKFGFMVHDTPTMLTRRKLIERANFMQEELNEFIAAVQENDLTGVADALVDLVYVAKGTAVQLGLPWQELFNEVHRSNMAKERGVGKRGNLVDLIKPEGWEQPGLYEILLHHGYDAFAEPVDDPEYRG